MSNHQVKQIKITSIVCKQAGHKDSKVEALCLNPACKENTTLCFHCVSKVHQFCKSYQDDLDEIPKMLMELRKFFIQTVVLQEQVNHQFKITLSKIEQILLPISKYEEKPDLTNLNEIGKFLRKLPEQKINEKIDDMKNEIKILFGDSIVQINQLQDNEYQNRGEELYQKKKYLEAIECFDKQISINNIKNESSLCLKGCSLQQMNIIEFISKLGLFDESNQCYKEMLTINPYNIIAYMCIIENEKAKILKNQ